MALAVYQQLTLEESVHVVAYDARWPQLYERKAATVRQALWRPTPELEHFGSTTVPGLWAKPIVDIPVGVDTLDLPAAEVHAMQDVGYECFGAGAVPSRVHFRKRGSRNFNVSVVLRGGDL